jgi:hypothetical protein
VIPKSRIAWVALLCWLPATAFAHGRSVSYSTWDLREDRATVTLRLTALELTRLRADPARAPLLDPGLSDYLTEGLLLFAGEAPCPVTAGPRQLDAPNGKVAFEWDVDCQGATPSRIESHLFLDVAPGHLHFTRLRTADEPTLERVLSLAEPGWPLGTEGGPSSQEVSPVGTSFGSYLALGIEHIATGYDHLVFVLALLLLASRLAEVATIVTGFTLAHSITLGLAVLGHLRPQAEAVEALIGLSIALVAAENAWLLAGRRQEVPWAVCASLLALAGLGLAGVGVLPAQTTLGLALFAACYFGVLARVARPTRIRVAIAFVFGLIHGFGFAGVLAEVALEPGRLAQALLGFNLGVEIGQLAIVALAWPLLRLATRGARGRWILEGGTAAIAATGVFLLVSRAFA